MIHTIEVIGDPAGYPRPRVTVRGGFGRAYTPDGPGKHWRNAVMIAALEQFDGDPITGPVRLSIVYRMPRPKNHWRTGKNRHLLRKSAPKWWHTTKPDRDNLNKGTKDGLGDAGVWKDDAQVCDGPCVKRYVQVGEKPGATITVEEIE